MSKFIKVKSEDGVVILQNMDNVEYFSDFMMCCVDGSVMDTEETIEQIESQLLRDEFAAAAMNAGGADQDIKCDDLARWSYLVADAMLKERLK